MKENRETNWKTIPKIWAVGGGKGGVGKSTVSVFLAFWLARMGKRTILMDIDLGGANLHSLMGINNPPRTLNDFITRKYESLEDICIDTEVKNLRLICGASEILSLANPLFAQKLKIIQGASRLDADYIVFDLGAGTSFNVLDFFLIAHKKIVVMTPQPTSIQNSYAFIRNAVYRRLNRLSSQNPSLQALIKIAMNTKNELKVQTIKELLQVIQELSGKEVMESLQKEIAEIQPAVITNMVENPTDKNAGRIIKLVAEKYLMIHPVDLGGVAYDRRIYTMVSGMIPLTKLEQSSEAVASAYEIVVKLL
ncbi:MAG: P-loop NTPase [Thermodesulfobacteriota bacterium]|nr:P-loop NTPase [Thermodesulfobacteriota bacterium]